MARLPQPGGDSGSWGDILNDYLSQIHTGDGWLKDNSVTANVLAPNSVTNAALASDAVNASIIQNGSITEELLDGDLQAKVNSTPPVTAVAGKTGAVTLVKGDVGLGSVDNTSDASKPISAATQAALDAKANNSGVVHTTGDETIAGVKTFSNSMTLTGVANNRFIVSTGSASGGISLGADVNAVSRTAGVRKVGVISSPNFSNTSHIEIFSSDSTSTTDNNLNFGGRAGGTQTAATTINFVTAPDTTTAGGTNRLTIDRSGKIGIGTETPTHTLTLGSSGDGIVLYNTTDQTTNYERARHHWNGGVYKIETLQGGTGLTRNIQMTAGITTLLFGDASGYGMVMRRNGTGISLLNVTSTGLLAGSGAQSGIVIDPVVNQSGTAGYSMLKINPTETTLGGGAKLLIEAQVGGVNKFLVYNTGETTSGNLRVTQSSGGNLTRGIVFTGMSIGNTDTGTGFLFSLGYNVLGNKQIWFGDPDNAGDVSKTFIRMNGTGIIDAISGNNTTRRKIAIGYESDDNSGADLGGNVRALYSATGHTSGTITPFRVAPTINDSGTAGYTAVDINVTETATGSGTKLLINAQVGGVSRFSVANDGTVTLAGSNIVTNTTNGTKIGTATTQRLGFWNATPIVQPTTSVAAATFTANAGTAINDTSTFDGYTVAQIVKALRNSGLLA